MRAECPVWISGWRSEKSDGTIIVNEKTHEPVKLLDGRNGDTLWEWLKNNKNIKLGELEAVNNLVSMEK